MEEPTKLNGKYIGKRSARWEIESESEEISAKDATSPNAIIQRANKMSQPAQPKQRSRTDARKGLARATGSALFDAVQAAQGYAFLSDDGDNLTHEQVLDRARASLHWTNQTAKILRRFIKRHSSPKR